MDEILLKAFEYGAVGGVAIALTYLWLKYGKPKDSLQQKTLDEIQMIGGNHLGDILDAIKDQTRSTSEDHKRQIEVLTEIKTILRERAH
jgi:hypothetical protein